LLPVCVLLSYFLVSMHIAKCFTNILMRSNAREWTHILLVNILNLHLHSFCATGMSTGPETRVTLTWVSWGRLGECYVFGLLSFWTLSIIWYSKKHTMFRKQIQFSVYFLEYQTMDKSNNSVVQIVIHHHHNPLELIITCWRTCSWFYFCTIVFECCWVAF
jgi:hypothetical protein